MNTPDDMLILGKVSGVYGVKGWVKLFSHTSPRDNILSYSPIYLKRQNQWQAFTIESGKRHGKNVVAKIESINTREAAWDLIDTDIAIPKELLPKSDNEYYWADLEGMRVATSTGIELGTVEWLFDTGSNDVVVVKGDKEHLLPWTDEVILKVDMESSLITVDWDEDF